MKIIAFTQDIFSSLPSSFAPCDDFIEYDQNSATITPIIIRNPTEEGFCESCELKRCKNFENLGQNLMQIVSRILQELRIHYEIMKS